jgi:type IV pilus assembly protein PilB
VTDHRPHLHAVAAEALQRPAEAWTGIRPPRRRGGSSRFLTDVLVELGYVDQARVAHATDKARATGSAPERMLLDEGAITPEQLSHAVAERYGLDHLDLGVFKVDMGAVNLLSASAAKRYSAVPVAYVDEHTVMVAMSDPANVLAVDDIALMTHMDV